MTSSANALNLHYVKRWLWLIQKELKSSTNIVPESSLADDAHHRPSYVRFQLRRRRTVAVLRAASAVHECNVSVGSMCVVIIAGYSTTSG